MKNEDEKNKNDKTDSSKDGIAGKALVESTTKNHQIRKGM